MPRKNTSGSLLTLDSILVVLMLLLFAFHLCAHFYHAFSGVPLEGRVPWTLLIPVYAGFAFLNAVLMLGWTRAVTFLGITAVISYLFEFFGERTGVIFGEYYYTDVLGPKLGPVPLIIPLAYFMLVLPSYVMTNLIVDRRPTAPPRSGFRLPIVALLAAIIMTGWDLSYDPLMANGFKAWIWVDGGPFFDIPLRNFAGWVLTSFSILVTYGWVEARTALSPRSSYRSWVPLLAVLSYAALGVGDTFAGYPEGTRVLSPFLIGIPVLAALLCLYPSRREVPRRSSP
jgi:putative membrane protein